MNSGIFNAFVLSLSLSAFFLAITPTFKKTEPEMIQDALKASVAIFNGNVIGSGFIVDGDYIVTNRHVITSYLNPVNPTIEMFKRFFGIPSYENPDKNIYISFHNYLKTYKVEYYASDKDADIAILKFVDKDVFPHKTLKINGATPPEGTRVIAIGNPSGQLFSVSQGIISSSARRDSSYPIWTVQTDVKVNPGNSGGPLINENGEVIGINEKILTVEGGSLVFAIAGGFAKKAVFDLINFKYIRYAKLGISGSNDRKTGQVVIDTVQKGSSASDFGIHPKDKILSIETQYLPVGGIQVHEFSDVFNEIIKLSPGDMVALTIERDHVKSGKSEILRIELPVRDGFVQNYKGR
jgi:putative serine protease PepD